MKVSCEMVGGGVARVAAAGYMNADGGSMIADHVRRVLAGGCTAVLIDLRQTRLVNHHGLLVLRRLCDEVAQHGVRISFCNLSTTVARTLEIFGIPAASPPGIRRTAMSGEMTTHGQPGLAGLALLTFVALTLGSIIASAQPEQAATSPDPRCITQDQAAEPGRQQLLADCGAVLERSRRNPADP
jgi:anti-anti-sigma factor